MTDRIRGHDWSTTLGAPSSWSIPLRTLIGIMVASQQPMFMAWGRERIWLYNDACIPILGRKHPLALGRSMTDVWSEVRTALVPILDRVFAGESVHMSDLTLRVDRHDRVEEAHFDFSHTPARDESGAVAGLFGVCTEITEQVFAQRRLTQLQERQRRLFAQAPGFVALVHGPDHVFEFANEAFMRLINYRDIIGKGAREAFPDLIEQGFHDLIDRVYQTGERYIAAQVLVRLHPAADGQPPLYMDFIYEPLIDEEGRVTGVFFQGNDVTDAHNAALELRANERRQTLLVELGDRFRDLDDPADLSYAAAQLLGETLGVSRAGYGRVNLVDETVTVERPWHSPAVRSLTGLIKLRDLGTYVDDLKRGEVVVFADAQLDPRTSSKAAALKALDAQAAVMAPVKESRTVAALFYVNQATPREWTAEEITLIRDVAERTRFGVERRRAEKALVNLAASLEHQVAERTAELNSVWRISRDLLVISNFNDGVIRAVNPAWTRILGYQTEEVVGRTFREFVWPEDEEFTQRAAERVFAACDVTDFENRYRHKDGTARWISWHAAAEGDLIYAYGRDITAQEEQARALAQAEEALRQSQKLEAMGQLTGGVAHDFNNLLTPIIGGLDMLQRKALGGPREQRSISGALQAAERARVLVQRLLAFARRQPLQPTSVDVELLVRGMSQLVASTAGPQIRVVVDIAEDLRPAIADPNQLEMAILNLSVNARDAMPDGGTLRISADVRTARAFNSVNLAPGTYVCLSVADSGVGMDEETLRRAIEPFFSTKGLGKGTGLGLSMVHGLAAQLGGGLRLSSHSGLGTNAELWLPVSEIPAVREHEATQSGDACGVGTALLVDDEALVRMSMADMLITLGFAVVEADSAERALELLKSGVKPDVLVTDHLMPGLTGVDLARAARDLTPGLPVLIVSGFAEETGAAPDLPRLTKPFRQAELAATLAEVMVDRDAARDLAAAAAPARALPTLTKERDHS